MKGFENGVRYYTAGLVEIYFPEDAVVCRACPLLKNEYGTKRDVCGKSGEFIPDPDRMIGASCPIEFDLQTEEETRNVAGQ